LGELGNISVVPTCGSIVSTVWVALRVLLMLNLL
jgi:hypothetical protein